MVVAVSLRHSRNVNKHLRRLLAVSAVATIGALQLPTLMGSVSLAFSAPDDAAAPPSITLDVAGTSGLALGMEGMMPGDRFTAAVEIRNDGGQELRYAVTAVPATAGDPADLASALTVAVHTADADAPGTAADADPCDQASGTLLRDAADVGPSAALVGDASTGAHAGDRTLAAGAAEVLCFTIELPITTGNAYQAASTSISFGFASEATANNP